MKRVLSTVMQFLLFLALDVLGSLFYQPFHIRTVLPGSVVVSRSFVWDGLILALLAFVVVVLTAAFQRRFAATAPSAAGALLLVALVTS